MLVNKKVITRKKRTNKKKKRAFTLIELLAVIIILGILIIVAIPSITTYVSDSRKKTYIVTAKGYINGARNIVNHGKADIYDLDTTYYIPISCIDTESGGESPYGKFKPAYVLVSYNGEGFDYYWASTDTAKMGIYHTEEADLSEDSIETGVTNIDTTLSIAPDNKVVLMDPTTCELGEKKNSTSTYLPKDKDSSNRYNIEYVPLTYDFSNQVTYYKNLNGGIVRSYMNYIYNEGGWSKHSGKVFYLFQELNDMQMNRYATMTIKIPQVKNSTTGETVGVKSWYYELHVKCYTDETWVCKGNANQTTVNCTPKEPYTVKIYPESSYTGFKEETKIYLYLEDGSMVSIKDKHNLHSYYRKIWEEQKMTTPTSYTTAFSISS